MELALGKDLDLDAENFLQVLLDADQIPECRGPRHVDDQVEV